MLRSIVRFSGIRLPIAIGVVAVSSLLEGAGLLLLIPLSELVFSGANSGNWLSQSITAAMQGFGLASVLGQLSFLSAVFLCLLLLRAIVLLYRDVLLMQLTQGYVDHVRLQSFAALAAADWPTLKGLQRAHLLDDMTINVARISAAMSFLSRGTITLVLLIVYVISGYLVNAWVGVILLALCVVTAVYASFRIRRIRQLGERMTQGGRQVMNETTRFLDGLKSAKSCHAEVDFIAQFKESIARTREIGAEFVLQRGRAARAVEFAGAVAAVALLLFGYGVLQLTGTELLTMAAIVLRLNPNLVAMLGGLQSIAFALPAFEATEKIRHQAMRNGTALSQAPPSAPPGIRAGGAMVFDKVVVCMGQGAGQIPLLTTTEFTLADRGLVHVAGPSGSGKSTFVELLAGLYVPTTGRLVRNGLSLSTDNRRAWQEAVAYVPQEPFLFNGTVRENLLWPNVAAADDAIWRALALAEADDLVRELPLGLDEMLYDNGNRLSGGQRQRLCIARALLRPSNLLILDEATSAIDPDVEAVILGNLARIAREKAVVIVSHSEATKRFADQQVNIASGIATLRP